jgi:hypothetical protein
MYELADGVIEFMRIIIKLDVEIPKLVEDEFFSLPVLEEEQCNKVLVIELDKFFSGKPWMIVILLLAKIEFQHKFMH